MKMNRTLDKEVYWIVNHREIWLTENGYFEVYGYNLKKSSLIQKIGEYSSLNEAKDAALNFKFD